MTKKKKVTAHTLPAKPNRNGYEHSGDEIKETKKQISTSDTRLMHEKKKK